MIISICVGLVFFLSNTYVLSQKEVGYGLKSNYSEDLKGEKIDTWISWHLTKGDLFRIEVFASPLVTAERMHVIKDVIFSNETVSVDNSVYYKGWKGVLYESSYGNTKLPLPLNLHITITDIETGNIIIKLTNLKNPHGYTAFTKSIVDVNNHKILRSEITVYEADELTDTQLATILRHELGHGFGLAHSNDPDDLMYPLIKGYRYISKCDIQALADLYDGKEQSQVICEK